MSGNLRINAANKQKGSMATRTHYPCAQVDEVDGHKGPGKPDLNMSFRVAREHSKILFKAQKQSIHQLTQWKKYIPASIPRMHKELHKSVRRDGNFHLYKGQRVSASSGTLGGQSPFCCLGHLELKTSLMEWLKIQTNV